MNNHRNVTLLFVIDAVIPEVLCLYLLVEICWSSEGASTVSDAGLTAAHWDTVVFGFFEPARVSPVRVVVDTTAMELKRKKKKRA